MPKQKPSLRVESIKQKQAALMAQLKEAQNRAKLEAKEKQRIKNEIAGSIALKELEANPSGSFAAALRNLLNANITKAVYRAMFDLPALPNTASNDDPQPAPPPKSPRRKKA
jgi:hypothetical protein